MALKARLIVLVVVLTMFGSVGTALGVPATASNGPQLSHLVMTSATQGWAVGADGILRTADGGHVWKTVLQIRQGPGQSGFTRVTFASTGTRQAWVVASAGSKKLRSYHTTNAGGSWSEHEQVIPDSAWANAPTQLLFSDPLHGWLLLYGQPGAGSITYTILRTADGGSSWRMTQKSGSCNGALNNLSFTGPKVGFKTGMCFAATQIQELYRTNDGGRTWSKFAVKTPGFKVSYFDAGLVWVTGSRLSMPVSLMSPSAFVLYRSGDGGSTWHASKSIQVKISCQHNHAVAFGGGCVSNIGPPYSYGALSSTTSWVLIKHVLRRTTNGGAGWSVMSRHTAFGSGPQPGVLPQIDFVTTRVGFVLPRIGRDIYVTFDSGRVWRLISARR